ncbi:putative metalloprotease CJM1_0395 family protein [Arcobacter sp. LA11]|uniref:putative metalloprotease CJM1_0395 family protein n=1 Tax=Arcobacter sp. LA11 TaxID=1898176 RepID=UPI0009349993|nr:putative metalloprotease CJM1_0395 family protein [Arcobacter sp. LA11]
MEINNFSQSSSLIYQELAQKRAELSNIDKKELEKSTQESYDKVNISDNKYDEKDYNRVLDKFKDLDAETKTHEQTHASGAPTTAPISYNYQVGPDGKLYATGGSVRFDTSIPDDEASANVKLEQLKDASSSVDNLSSADAQIARTANLNKLLLQSQDYNQGESNEN